MATKRKGGRTKETDKPYEGVKENIGVKTVQQGRSCKICSKHQDLVPVIDAMLAAQIPYRQISKMIQEEHGTKITIYDLSIHKRHMDDKLLGEIEVEFDEDIVKELKRAESLQHERTQNQILAERLRAVLNHLIKNNLWKHVRPDMLRALADLYKAATSEVRLAAAEEYRQIEHDETDMLNGLLKMIDKMKGDNNESKKVSGDAKGSGGNS